FAFIVGDSNRLDLEKLSWTIQYNPSILRWTCQFGSIKASIILPNILMDEKLSDVLMLPLKDISLRRVAVILCSQTDILSLDDAFAVEYKVEDNVRKFELPPLLKEQIKYLVKPIHTEMRNWKKFHEEYLKNSYINTFCNNKGLCWTNLGTVDYQKTAEKLISCEMLDIVKRYRLACLYCLEDYIPVLWKKLPEKSKRSFMKKKYLLLYIRNPKLEFCWPYILKGEETKLDNMLDRQSGNLKTFNQIAFEYSAYIGNKAATEYFFRKLTYGEREASLYRATTAVLTRQLKREFVGDNFPPEKRSDTSFYLLSQINPEQQMEIFKRHPCSVLMCLLDWPWQHLFLDIAEHIWNCLTPYNYFYLLLNISRRIKIGYCLTKLFQEFFLHGDDDFKKCFVDQECHSASILRDFFDNQEMESIKVIFRNVYSVERKRLVSSESVFKLFYNSILNGKWHLIQLCIQEATLSIEDKSELKEAYCRFLAEIHKGQKIKWSKWEQLFQFFLD
ncbi:hypothetical protein AVEN_152305-1, partial [Araneus ventricosus]